MWKVDIASTIYSMLIVFAIDSRLSVFRPTRPCISYIDGP